MASSIKVNKTQIQAVENILIANTVFRKAHFLAQCHAETSGFYYKEENLAYGTRALRDLFGKYFKTLTDAQITKNYAYKPQKIANRIYANRMGNGSEASGDGWKYRGRGYIQLTGKSNYIAFQNSGLLDSGDNVIVNPDLVASKYPLRSASFFFSKNDIWTYCDHGAADPVVVSVSAAVNTGNPNSNPDKIIHLDTRRECFKAYYEYYTGTTPPGYDQSNEGLIPTSETGKKSEEQPSWEKTFEQIGVNIANIEADQVDVTWGKRTNSSEDSDWISLKQFILYLASKYTPQSLLPFVELIPEVSMNNGYYDKDGTVPDNVKNSTGSKSSKFKDKIIEKAKELDKELPKGSFYTDSNKAKLGQETFNKGSGVADLTTLDPWRETQDWMGVPNEGGKQIIELRKVGVRAFGQLVLSPGALDKSASKPGPIGFQEFEIKSGAQCDNGLALISMKLVDIQGNKFTDLTSPWSFIYDTRPGAVGGDFWFRYGWQLRLPFYDKKDKTSWGFWNHPGWDIFGNEVKWYIINQILPWKPYITLTQNLSASDSNTKDKNGNILGDITRDVQFNSMFDDGIQYDEESGSVTISRSNLTEANYVKLAILNPEITMNQNGSLIADLSFRTTGSICHQMPLAFAHNLRRVISETTKIILGDLLVAYLSDLESFQNLLDSDEVRKKRDYLNSKRSSLNLTKSRNFDGFVHIVGLGKGAGAGGSVHPDSIWLEVSKKKVRLLEDKVPDNEMTIIRWFREVLEDNGCALQSAATGSGAGINSAWIIAVTDDFEEERYKPSKWRQSESTNGDSSIDGTKAAATTLALMQSEKDVFSYRFQGALNTQISVEKSDAPNAMKVDVNFAVGDFLTYDGESVKTEKVPVTTTDRQRNLKILFAQMQNVKVTALCHPWIGPGKNIFIKGLGFFDGEYMVLSCSHKLDNSNSFTSELEAARILKDDNTADIHKENVDNKQEEGGNTNKSKQTEYQKESSTKEKPKENNPVYTKEQKDAVMKKKLKNQELTAEEKKTWDSLSPSDKKGAFKEMKKK